MLAPWSTDNEQNPNRKPVSKPSTTLNLPVKKHLEEKSKSEIKVVAKPTKNV